MSVFFLGSWDLFVPRSDSFPMNQEKNTHSLNSYMYMFFCYVFTFLCLRYLSSTKLPIPDINKAPYLRFAFQPFAPTDVDGGLPHHGAKTPPTDHHTIHQRYCYTPTIDNSQYLITHLLTLLHNILLYLH